MIPTSMSKISSKFDMVTPPQILAIVNVWMTLVVVTWLTTKTVNLRWTTMDDLQRVAGEPCEGRVCSGSGCSHERTAAELTAHDQEIGLYGEDEHQVDTCRMIFKRQ